jgi:hypothetical protein
VLTPVATILAELARVLNAAGTPFYVFGAQAVAAAGVPRFTDDIDITARVDRDEVPSLITSLRSAGFDLRDVGDTTTFIAQTRVIPMMHAASNTPIDVVLAGPGLEEEILGRVIMRAVAGVPIPFVATNDLIALKLLAGREKDLEDVRALLRAKPPDLAVDEARRRVGELGALLDDSTLLATFDKLVAKK